MRVPLAEQPGGAGHQADRLGAVHDTSALRAGPTAGDGAADDTLMDIHETEVLMLSRPRAVERKLLSHVVLDRRLRTVGSQVGCMARNSHRQDQDGER